MAKMFDTLMSAKARYVLFETSNPRHGHEWAVFRDRKGDIPDDKVLVPGVVDTTTNFVEHPDLVAQRIERFVDIVGADRVIAAAIAASAPSRASARSTPRSPMPSCRR
jgi:5-methyltetrahydropteroyltriglutamate--homocysteine methyltransferase